MRKRWSGAGALLIGAALLGAGAVGASAHGTGSPSTGHGNAVVDSAKSGWNSVARLVGIEEERAAPGTIDDGKDLLPQATITLEQAIAAAQAAQSGALGEVDLEHVQGTLVFNVDIGDSDVKVDAATGAVLAVGSD